MIAGLRIALAFLAFALLTLALLPVQVVALGLGHSVMRQLPRWWHRLMCRVIITVLDSNPAPGAYGLMLAMGPGFCSELVLLRW